MVLSAEGLGLGLGLGIGIGIADAGRLIGRKSRLDVKRVNRQNAASQRDLIINH